MTSTSQWFGDTFSELHPLLQQLHLHGGSLTGDVTLQFGKGIAGWLGRRLAKKLTIPTESGVYPFTVIIKHTDKQLHWGRCFNNRHTVTSIFTPVGNKQTGYWIESTGAIQLYLTVNIHHQGWYWQPLKMKLHNIPLPMRLMPKTTAYKYIEAGQYRFHVSFSWWIFGTLLSYSGLLSPEVVSN